jgi:AcrR family transcriptional regulator
MPARARTSNAEIVRAARVVLERRGLEAFSLQEVAAAVGVRAPSLYNRYRDRGALLEAVAEHFALELRDRIVAANGAPSDRIAIATMAHAYRGYARRWPRSYRLLFADRVAGPASRRARAAAAAPLLARMQAVVGRGRALASARLIAAWMHGFVSMELAEAFGVGDAADHEFERGLGAMMASVSR